MSYDPDVMNAEEAAHFLGAHVETVRRLARNGEIPAYKVGKDWRFRREALRNWIDSQSFRSRPPNILVVDDQEDYSSVVRRFCEPEGYVVHTALTGEQGLASVLDHRIDLILLDLKMPGMNGPEFLRELRKIHPDLPVIIVTGYPDSELMLEASRYGPLMLLSKPVNKDQALSSMRIALDGALGRKIE